MGYVAINEDNRIIAHGAQLVPDLGIVIEADNEEIIDTYQDLTCSWAMTDFVYQDGHLIYDPPRDKVNEERLLLLKKSLADTDYYASQALEDLFDALGQIEPYDLLSTIKIIKAVIKWNISVMSKYSSMIVKRRSWRVEIQQIENLQQQQTEI